MIIKYLKILFLSSLLIFTSFAVVYYGRFLFNKIKLEKDIFSRDAFVPEDSVDIKTTISGTFTCLPPELKSLDGSCALGLKSSSKNYYSLMNYESISHQIKTKGVKVTISGRPGNTITTKDGSKVNFFLVEK